MKKKLLIGIVGGGAVYLVLTYFGLAPGLNRTASIVPQAVDLSATPDGIDPGIATGPVTAVALPKATPAALRTPPIRITAYPWTAQLGILYAIGGAQTTEGSLFAKHGVNARFVSQTSLDKMRADHLAFANALAGGQAHPTVGTHFVIMMGDGSAQYKAALNEALKELGPEYKARTAGAVGYSRGEDACWGPQEWKDSPEAARGGVIAAYLRDGDWNLCQYWLANAGIKNNPDETTYDPDAVNWVHTEDHLKATEAYVAGYCESRPIVRAGKVTRETKADVCVNGVATWTPGDVNLAAQKGGLVPLISTKENAYQMPAVVIGIEPWLTRNAKLVESLLLASFEGGDQVKHHEAALSRAGLIAANVYEAENAAYWVRYYKGERRKDKTGQMVPLGGSVTMNLADNLILFGLVEGSGGLKGSLFKASYEGFGNVVKQQYPSLLPSFPPVEDAVNTTFITNLASRLQPKIEEEANQVAFVESNGPIEAAAVVAKKDWTITFNTGQATFTPQAAQTLDELYNQLIVGGALAVQIEGHTDDVGPDTQNQFLSERRALAVKQFLEARASRLFPAGRVNAIGYGESRPVLGNNTELGRAANRRVTIVLGTQQ